MSNPNSAISIDNGLFLINETLVMYFCWFCGGKLPDSSKPIFVPYITAEERARLQTLIEGIDSPEEAITRLGAPDYDEPMLTYHKEGEDMPIVGSGIKGLPDDWVVDESVPSPRNIEYYELSKTAHIEFYFDGGQLTESRIISKGLPPRHLEEGEIV